MILSVGGGVLLIGKSQNVQEGRCPEIEAPLSRRVPKNLDLNSCERSLQSHREITSIKNCFASKPDLKCILLATPFRVRPFWLPMKASPRYS